MSNPNLPPRVNLDEAQIMCFEATGAWEAFLMFFEQWHYGNGVSEYGPRVWAYEKDACPALLPYMITSLAFNTFVLPFERYLKYCKSYRKEAGLSEAFGLHQYNEQSPSRFRHDYPGALIDDQEWWETEKSIADGYVHIFRADEEKKTKPHWSPKDNWFASMIRNSFAHGQCEFKQSPKHPGEPWIELHNSAYGESADFRIRMRLDELIRLLVNTQKAFIKCAVNGDLKPLSTLLEAVEGIVERGGGDWKTLLGPFKELSTPRGGSFADLPTYS